jgi:hypothetical protein
MRPLSPTAWVAVIVAAVAAFVALGTAGAVAARGDTFTAAKRKPVTAGPRSPAPGSPSKPQPTTTQHDGMLEKTGDQAPCVWVDRTTKQEPLPYRCPLLWDSAKTSAAMTRVPVFAQFTSPGLGPSAAVNHLYREAGAQYFRCHLPGAAYEFAPQYGWGRARHTWWALTQGDEHPGKWGFVPEVYFLGGADDQPDPGLPMCGDDDLARVA